MYRFLFLFHCSVLEMAGLKILTMALKSQILYLAGQTVSKRKTSKSAIQSWCHKLTFRSCPLEPQSSIFCLGAASLKHKRLSALLKGHLTTFTEPGESAAHSASHPALPCWLGHPIQHSACHQLDILPLKSVLFFEWKLLPSFTAAVPGKYAFNKILDTAVGQECWQECFLVSITITLKWLII